MLRARLISLFVIGAVLGASLAGLRMVPAAAQTAPLPVSALAAIVLPGVKSAPSAFGVYLGHGLVITNWHPWTLDGRFYTDAEPSISPSRQVALYDDDGSADPGEDLLDLADCGGTWQSAAEADAACQPFARINGAGFLFPGAGDTLQTSPVPIERLVYANRAYDVALFAVDAEAVAARGVTPARLSLDLPALDAAVAGVYQLPEQPPVTATGTFESGEPVLLPDVAYQLGGPWRVPSLILSTDAALLDGSPVFDTARGDLIGLAWRAGEDGASWITPAAQWGQALFAANDALMDAALSAVLAEAAVTVTQAPLTLDDPLAPELGNGGIDVQHYTLDLTLDATAGTVSGTAVLDIRATLHKLLTFALDDYGLEVSRVTIDGADAPYVAKQAKLVIQLPQPVDYGTRFQVAITYRAAPQPFRSRYVPFFDIGMFVTDGRISTLDEPDAAHTWFPCNDHPADRATYDFRLRVAQPLTAVANGQLVEQTDNGDGTRTFLWNMPYPMATYLAMVAAADYTLIEDRAPDGVPIRNYVYSERVEDGRALFAQTGEALALLETLFGPYPYASYGHVVVPSVGMALETQTMTIMPDSLLDTSAAEMHDLLVHELAHQWYGDTVTLGAWSDIWLNEGFATLSEWLAREYQQGASSAIAARSTSEQSLLTDRRTTPLTTPAAGEMFGIASYDKGAWVLHMLRGTIGDEAFFALLRAYAEQLRDRPTSTLALWQLAEQVSGQDLAWFFDQWLLQGDLPRYTLYWTETESGADVLLCPTRPATYRLDLPLRFASGDQQADAVLTVDETSAQASYTLPFVPSDVIPDPDQAVLAGVQVQPIATLPALCPPPVLQP